MIDAQSMQSIISVNRYFCNGQTDGRRYQNTDMAAKGSEDLSTFGKRLRSARKERKMSQTVLGGRVGLSQSVISDLETGESHDTTKILELAHECQVHADWLKKGRGPRRLSDAAQPANGTISISDQQRRRRAVVSPLLSELRKMTTRLPVDQRTQVVSLMSMYLAADRDNPLVLADICAHFGEELPAKQAKAAS